MSGGGAGIPKARAQSAVRGGSMVHEQMRLTEADTFPDTFLGNNFFNSAEQNIESQGH